MTTSNTRSPELQEGQLNQGIKSSRSNIGVNWGLDESTINAHIGHYDGVGPRHGMMPIPNHNHNEGIIGVNDPAPLQIAERAIGVNTQTTNSRSRVFSVAQLSATDWTGQSAGIIPNSNTGSNKIKCFFWAISYVPRAAPSETWFGWVNSASLSSIDGSSNMHEPISYMDSSLSCAEPESSSVDNVSRIRYSYQRSFSKLLKIDARKYIKTISFSVSGQNQPSTSFLANCFGPTTTAVGLFSFDTFGFPRSIFYQDFKLTSQNFDITTLDGSFVALKKYDYTNFEILNSYFTRGYANGNGASIITLPNSTAVTNINSGTSAFCYVKMPTVSTSSQFTLFCAAPGRAVVAVWQDWYRNAYKINGTVFGSSFQYVDISSILASPPSINTIGYSEYSKNIRTCWSNWRAYDGTTAVPIDPGLAGRTTGNIYTGPAGSGVLRAKTTYQFAFSLFDKSTNHESNVGDPSLILTGTDDFVKLGIYLLKSTDPQNTGPISFSTFVLTSGIPQSDFMRQVNHVQYRFYYRERGSFEWLPAGQIDATELYSPLMTELWLCEGPFASSVGGQPGGFNDYSALASDTYFDTLNYRQRLFWMSEKQLSFSRSDDVFAYPAANSVTCPKGRFLGMIAHTYPGQSEQNSRLIIFGSEEVYAARFLGANYARQQSVRVSANSAGVFPVDGSDFNIDIWTSHTAFSSRSAVIAKGILYWWGPTGIYRDVGNELPEKDFSLQIEPLLFNLYDPNKIQEIHAVYNDITKEIIWFYPPNPKLGKVQRALSYKVTDGSFFVWDFGNAIVDSSQTVDAQFSNSNAKDNSGLRVMLMIRDNLDLTIAQRAVFFDDMCDSGDVTCSRTMLVKQVSVQGANRRLTLAAGFAVALPTTGNLTVSNYQDYRDTTATSPDGIYAIAGSDGATYIDIAPISGSWAGFDFLIETITDTSKFFPIFTDNLNGFSFRVSSQYWAPFGWRFWGRWLYCYQSYRAADLLRSSGQTIQLQFATILGTSYSPRVVTLTDNSRGNCQVHSQIVFNQQNADGQAMAITITTPTGKFNGSRWSLQYLSYDVTEMTKNNFKTWEG